MRAFALTSRPSRWFFFLALITAGAACAPPLQNGGVEVRSGAAERLGMVCRWRHGGASGEGLCGGPEEEEEEALAPARVESIAGPGDALAGPLAAGALPDAALSPAKHREK